MDQILQMDASVIAAQLGGPAKIGTEIDNALDPVRAIESGIRIDAADHLAAQFGLGAPELCAMLRISRATLRARRRRGRLYSVESERLWRVAGVLAHAAQTLGDHERAGRWIVRGRPVQLGGWRPIELLAWETGAQEVRNVLGRIEHGIVA